MFLRAAFCLFAAAMAPACCLAADFHAGELRLNQIQMLATHNSYHLRPAAAMLKAAIAIRKDAKEWDYSRQPLDQQLEAGVRSFELDLHLGPQGWQVMHVPTFDPGTTVATFADALAVISTWSEAHPGHVPISLLLELKSEGYALNKAFRKPMAEDLLLLDSALRSGLGAERLLVPDDVRESHATLWEAVSSDGWPTLSRVAGKVFAILHERGENRAAYLAGHESLEGRAMFVESDLGQPHSAVLIRNDPTDPQIAELAREGYLIRTRVDSQGEVSAERRATGLASGAQLLTTDYPPGEETSQRAFTLPDGAVVRVNPVTGPQAIRESRVSEPVK